MDRYSVSRTKRSLFYLMMTFLIVGFIIAECILPSERSQSVSDNNITYEGSFTWEKSDGEREAIEVPGRYDVKPGDTMVITTVLPDDFNASVMAIRASLQTVRFYVDGSLRAEYDTKDTRPFGKDSASRYVFCNMSEDDAGKELRIELTSHASNYSGVVNTVYCGEKSDIWTNIFHNSSRETIIAFFIFFAAVVSVMFSIALSIVYKTHFDMEYVGWCMLLGAIWMLGESKLRQMLVPNASVLAAMCFVVILISPIAVSIYIDSIQGGRYTRVYTCIEALAAVNFIVCTALQLFGVCDYIETLPAGQGMLAVCCAVVITTFIIDIIKHRTLGYRPEMVAMIIALVLVLIEAASVYFVVTMSGFFIGTGLIVILFVNIIVTIKRISEIEYKRQKEESDRLRNQTERVSLQMMKTLAATIEAKDDYMRGHSYRVAEYSALIAKQLGWSEHEVENLRNAAYLHDIGKIGVPDTILNKPTRLTDEEFAAIKSHTVMGADILKDITLLDHLVDIARNHHERYDGKGYPDGLVGEEIPLSARIVCVADSYDAMKSRRIYRNALPDEEIRRELLDNCGTQFDPQISRMFVDMLDNGMVEGTHTGWQSTLLSLQSSLAGVSMRWRILEMLHICMISERLACLIQY